MAKIKTASEVLELIEKSLFKDVDLMTASLLKGDERKALILSQVDRLLIDKNGDTLMAMWLSDMFWTADNGRYINEQSPLMTKEGLQTLTKEQKSKLKLIQSIAGLCHDLSLHFMFDLKEAFGIRNNFQVSNKQLIEWLTTTEYEQIAMHTAYTLKKYAIEEYEGECYQPAQDGLAELFSREYCELIRTPNNTKIPSRAYVKTILDEMLRIERHWLQGRRRKLNPEVIKIHDEMYGFVPLRFSSNVQKAAQELFDYMEKNVKGRLVMKVSSNASWSEQPESVKRNRAEVLGKFADKIREIRTKHLAANWLNDDSLEFSYLMAHAEWYGLGLWNKEDEAL